MLGSDWPFVPWHPSPVTWVQGLASLTKDEIRLLSRERGLPTAMQLLGPAWSEELLCATATALEEVTPWAAQKPQPARQ